MDRLLKYNTKIEEKGVSIDEIMDADNIADLLSDDELSEIGLNCRQKYQDDKDSRAGWESAMSNANKLALQVYEEKNTPWPGASNVKFPLITVASIQFNSRSYHALVNGTDIVRHRVIGEDPTGQKAARAKRVSTHMSYQFLEEDVDWEEEMDKLLMVLPITGCAFKKSYFDTDKQRKVSYCVLPSNLVINYYATSLEDAECVSEILGDVSKRKLTERIRTGLYRDVELTRSMTSVKDKESKDRQGLSEPHTGEFYTLIEQHTYYDIDGDGYEEPYVVTFDLNSGQVLRIVKRFDDVIYSKDGKQVAKIEAENYYTKYKFMPSPDGGIYELGFGVLIGPINEAVNTALNQLVDAGTLANTPSGFLGRGARLKKGAYHFTLGEFKEVNCTGDDLRKNIFMLPVREPSSTLFNLLSLLIEYGERISSVSDMMVGKTPGQNTPATTAMASLEQGQQVFTTIHKRVYKSLQKEIRRAYELNAKYLNPTEYFQVVEGENQKVFQTDYQGDPTDVRPSADPAVASDQQRLMKAEAVRQAANTSGLYDKYQVERRYLEALQTTAIDEVLPPPGSQNAPQPPEPPLKEQAVMIKAETEAQYKMSKLPLELELLDAQIGKLEADALSSLAKAEAEDDKVTIETYRTYLEELRDKRERINGQRDIRGMESNTGNAVFPEVPA